MRVVLRCSCLRARRPKSDNVYNCHNLRNESFMHISENSVQLQRLDNVIDVSVVEIVQIPRMCVMVKTDEIPQSQWDMCQ